MPEQADQSFCTVASVSLSDCCSSHSLQVFQGLLRAHKDYHDTKNAMSRLWVHECFRVFCDRLVGEKDQETFLSLISEKLGSIFDLTYHNLCPNKIPPIFGIKPRLCILSMHHCFP